MVSFGFTIVIMYNYASRKKCVIGLYVLLSLTSKKKVMRPKKGSFKCTVLLFFAWLYYVYIIIHEGIAYTIQTSQLLWECHRETN